MKKITYLVVNGIHADMERVRQFSNSLQSLICDDDAVNYVLWESAWYNHFKKTELAAEALADEIRKVKCNARDVVVICHSCGAEVLVKALKKTHSKVLRGYIFGGYLERDFEKNGLNEELRSGELGEVHVFFSKEDAVLKYFSRIGQWVMRLFGLCDDCGSLGYKGARNVDKTVSDRVKEHKSESDHCDYFTENYSRYVAHIESKRIGEQKQ